jgi:hypothetical protein
MGGEKEPEFEFAFFLIGEEKIRASIWKSS